jgi:biopolymer transport protein ExbD
MRLGKRRHNGEGGENSTGIDLAPMLDFVTNLLIFFIITAVFVKESAVQVNRPTSFEQESKEDSKSIQVQVLENGEIWVDNRAVDVRAVRANVERLSAVSPDAGVLILAQARAPTGTLVDVVDQVHLGGIQNITFSTTQ